MDKAGILISWSQLFVVIIVLLCFYLAELGWIWLRYRKSQSNETKQLLNKVDQLECDLAQLKQQIANVVPNDALILTKQEELLSEANEKSQADSLYSQAIRMAKNGADAKQIGNACGLAHAEAELIVAIYRGVYKG